jgi:EAL domain-containing protein (putative c-di-GMP-specific phosphodiesterase class I)
MREKIMYRINLETELAGDCSRGIYRLYQPIISLKDENFLGFEALVRWNHPERGLVAPGEFIPVAEETGLILSIDRWVMRQACLQVLEWQNNIPGLPPIHLSINMASKQIFQPDWLDFLKQVLQETGMDPQNLNLEITESAVMENHIRTIETLDALRNMGVEVQVDDFGIGYSSLGYLSRFSLEP